MSKPSWLVSFSVSKKLAEKKGKMLRRCKFQPSMSNGRWCAKRPHEMICASWMTLQIDSHLIQGIECLCKLGSTAEFHPQIALCRFDGVRRPINNDYAMIVARLQRVASSVMYRLTKSKPSRMPIEQLESLDRDR